MTEYDRYTAERTYGSRRRERRRSILWLLLILFIFAFCLGVLVGAVTNI